MQEAQAHGQFPRRVLSSKTKSMATMVPLAIAWIIGVALPVAAGPVDDVRDGVTLTFQETTATVNIKAWFLFAYVTIFSTNGTTVGGDAIPKASGTLDTDIVSFISELPTNFPPIVMTGTELPGDIIQWEADQDINDLFEFEGPTNNFFFYIRNVSVNLKTMASNIPIVYDPSSEQVLNVRLDDIGGHAENGYTITGNVSNESGQAILIEVTDMDYYLHAGLGDVPEPSVSFDQFAGTNISLVTSNTLAQAPYQVFYCTNLLSTNWINLAEFTASNGVQNWSFSMPENDEMGFIYLAVP